MKSHLLAMSLFSMVAFDPFAPSQPQTHVLALQEFSLDDRYANPMVNAVFKDNILLTLQYMEGSVHTRHFSWDQVTQPTSYTFTLDPKQTFAFHNDILPQYKDSLARTTNAHFSSDEGFQSDGYLVGDGVCHFASLINWVAKDAGLAVSAPTNHNFAAIPEVPKEYGVAIYDNPNNASTSAEQNLYITNNQDKPVDFTFVYKEDKLTVSISEEK